MLETVRIKVLFDSYKNIIATTFENSLFNNSKSLCITATGIVCLSDSNCQETFETSPGMCCGYKDNL
jgi:hypothetical protein